MTNPEQAEIDRLVAELEQAEAYEQRLRQLIVDVRDQMAAGNAQAALSMLNAALSDIDAATDVVTPHRVAHPLDEAPEPGNAR